MFQQLREHFQALKIGLTTLPTEKITGLEHLTTNEIVSGLKQRDGFPQNRVVADLQTESWDYIISKKALLKNSNYRSTALVNYICAVGFEPIAGLQKGLEKFNNDIDADVFLFRKT